MVISIEIAHNTFLYLSKQSVDIVAHMVTLAKLSYTVVEETLLDFFKRGYLNMDEGNMRDSRLQPAYRYIDIFIYSIYPCTQPMCNLYVSQIMLVCL